MGSSDGATDDQAVQSFRDRNAGTTHTCRSGNYCPPAAPDTVLAADQAVFTLGDVYTAIRDGSADLLVLGLHESGGIEGMIKAASVGEAVAVNICNHAVIESGITTCKFNQAAACIPNLDDGNQITSQLLEEDLIKGPDLEPVSGNIPVIVGPGLGFDLVSNAVRRAARA